MHHDSKSIKIIAEKAGVSTATVSRAFSRPDMVSAATKEKIDSICNELDYSPRKYKYAHRASNHDPFIAIVVADLKNDFFQEIIERVRFALSQKNIALFSFDSQESAEQELHCLNLLEQLHADGIFISPVTEKSQVNADMLMNIYKKGTPVILIDRDIKGMGLDGVFQDSYLGALEAVKCLIDNGHKHIAHLAGPINSKPGLDRLNGYLDALEEKGLPVNQEYIMYGNFMQESGYQLTNQLLQSHPEITAIFSANNLMSMGALQAIYDAKLSIPEDIAFISTGSLDIFDPYNHVTISKIEQPIADMGEECARLMLDRLSASIPTRRKISARRTTFNTTLVLNGSEIYPTNRK